MKTSNQILEYQSAALCRIAFVWIAHYGSRGGDPPFPRVLINVSVGYQLCILRYIEYIFTNHVQALTRALLYMDPAVNHKIILRLLEDFV